MEPISQPIVIDNGTGLLKAGFAGATTPSCIIPSVVGRPKHTRIMAGAIQGDYFFGQKVEQHRGLLTLQHPVAHGIVEDWGAMERIWAHTYINELKVSPDEHPVLLTEAPLNPKSNRQRTAEIFFEVFNVPALYISVQAVLSLYASGRTTGVVVDSGDGVTQCVPVVDGFVLPHAITRVDLAGRDVTQHLQLLLRKSGYRFNTTAEQEIVASIKEKACFIYPNEGVKNSVDDYHIENLEDAEYVLPDGSKIKLGKERYLAPEILFQPSLIGEEQPGIHDALWNTIQKSDIHLRTKLQQTVLLSGGTTLFPGFGKRLLTELERLAPRDSHIKIQAPPERKYSTWIGGSILASLDTFKKIWITRKEWNDDKESCLQRKLL